MKENCLWAEHAEENTLFGLSKIVVFEHKVTKLQRFVHFNIHTCKKSNSKKPGTISLLFSTVDTILTHFF